MFPVFVYGTLKPGESAYDTFCAPHGAEATPALTRGCLFHLPQGYPALTVGDRWVTGALLTFPDDRAIAHMDAFEDYDPARPAEHNAYIRQRQPVFAPDYTALGEAWLYVMAREQVRQCGGVWIPEGVWSRSHWPSI